MTDTMPSSSPEPTPTPTATPTPSPTDAATPKPASAPTPDAASVESEDAVEPKNETETVEKLTMMAHNYMVPFSHQAMMELSEGKDTVPAPKAEAFEHYLVQTAMGLYPALAKQIQAGLQPAFLLDPYRQAGKMTLGADFEPDFATDDKVRAVFAGAVDPTTNRPTMMTIPQWTSYLRTEPSFGWSQTPQGQQAMADIKSKISAGFQQGGQ